MVETSPTPAPDRAAKRVLDPIERVSEVLFGLIMVLTFTGSLSVASATREDTREMLIGAIGCNIAWGIVDALMYLMTSLTDRARALKALRQVRTAADPSAAHRHIADALPTIVASVLNESDLETMRARLSQLPEPPRKRILGMDDIRGALGVFLLVFLSTLPVALPFLFITEARPAMRVSNTVAIVLLFFCGFALGRHAGYRPWLVGLAMVFVGTVLAGITLALGG
jgi:VIT1/CCC1 family predicted Fe2+/Mn2+ transporter